MPRKAKVFISCGQRGAEEHVAKALRKWFMAKKQGFDAYVACEAQSLDDVMTISRELESADYFVFIDLRREALLALEDVESAEFKGYRGSLFVHQEASLAHHHGIGEKVIDQQQRGLEREGFVRYVLLNPEPFDAADPREILRIVKRLVKDRKEKWSPTFSRHLAASMPEKPAESLYSDHLTGTGWVRRYIWPVHIHNRRSDRTALNVTATLQGIHKGDEPLSCQDNTWLTWWGHHHRYSMVIPPNQERAFDALSIDVTDPTRVYLNSLFDITSLTSGDVSRVRQPVIEGPGVYGLSYRLDAIGFPPLEFDVQLHLCADWGDTRAIITSDDEQETPLLPAVHLAADVNAYEASTVAASRPVPPGSGIGGG
jgi:hypothetical protein